MKHAFAYLLLPAILSLPVSCAAAESDPIPSDFKLRAQYFPGYSDWKPWNVTVTADGKVLQETRVPRSGKEKATEKTSTLTAKQLQDLLATVRASQFFTLKKRYSYNVTDNPTLTLRVTMDGTSQEVEVYAPRHLKDNEEVKRFLKLWNDVLRKVPAPNAEQKPD